MADLRVAQEAPARPSAEAVLHVIDGLVAELQGGRRVEARLESSLDRELGLDSLARVEMLARLEQRFGVRLPEDVLSVAETPGDLVTALARGAPGLIEAEVPRERLAHLEQVVGLPDTASSLSEVLAWHVARHPRRRHVSFYSAPETVETLTYGELSDAAQHIAGALIDLGLRRGQCVGIMLPSGLDFFRCFYGILYAGAIPVPLYPPARRSQIEDHLRRQAGILRNCEAQVLIAFDAVRPLTRLLTGLAPELARVVTPDELAGGKSMAPAAVASGEIGLLQYTSGSTGNPKGVTLTHANLLANIRGWGKAVEVSSADVCVSWLPLYHDMGLIGAWLGSLYHACPLVLMSPLEFLARPERWLWAIHRHRGTVTASPNFAFDLCVKRMGEVDLTGLDLSSWRYAANGAEPVRAESLERFGDALAPYGLRREALSPVYGLAECTVGLTITPPGSGLRSEWLDRDRLVTDGVAEPLAAGREDGLRVVCCGYPLAGHEVRIVDGNGRPLPERSIGRLQFRGPSATCGYYRNEEANHALFDGEWLDSGDLGYLADGAVYLTGRQKDLIIRGGRNFYPYDLEQAVGDLPGVRKGCVAVFGVPAANDGGESLVVVAETRERDEGARARMQQSILSIGTSVLGLPPDRVVLAAPHAVLKTSSGKIRRAEIRERYLTGRLAPRERPPWQQVMRLAAGALSRSVVHAAQRLPAWGMGAWCWLVFGMLAAVAIPAVLILPTVDARWAVVRALARVLAGLVGVRITVTGAPNLPDGPCVLVANHASYVDALVLTAALPRRMAFVGKVELRGHWLVGPLLARLGVRFVERFEARQSVEDAAQLTSIAAEDAPLMFFAEGTFTRQAGLRAFRLGAFQVAARRGLPVVPVALCGARQVLPDGTWRPRPGAVTVTICPPVLPEGEGWHGVLALRDRTRQAILRDCGEREIV